MTLRSKHCIQRRSALPVFLTRLRGRCPPNPALDAREGGRRGDSSALPRQRLTGLDVAFERREQTIQRIGARFRLGLALGQRFRNSRKADEPPTVSLPLERKAIAQHHFSPQSLLSAIQP